MNFLAFVIGKRRFSVQLPHFVFGVVVSKETHSGLGRVHRHRRLGQVLHAGDVRGEALTKVLEGGRGQESNIGKSR